MSGGGRRRILANPRLKVDADATFVSLKLTERGAPVVDVTGGGANYDASFTGEDTRSSHLASSSTCLCMIDVAGTPRSYLWILMHKEASP